MSFWTFIAPDGEGLETLPIPFEYTYNPPWIFGREVCLRRQAWDLLLQVIGEIDPEEQSFFERESCNRNGNLAVPYNEQHLKRLIDLIDQTIAHIYSLSYELSEYYNKEEYKFTNTGYRRMLWSIQAVFKESLRLKKPYLASDT